MTTHSKNSIKIFSIIFIVVIVIGYSLFSARHIIKGPTIIVDSPKNGELTSDEFLEIKGRSENLNYISLNDRQIYIDDEGNFTEKLVLFTGENTLKFYGKDKFGREITKYIQVVAPKKEPSPSITVKEGQKTTASTTKDLSLK